MFDIKDKIIILNLEKYFHAYPTIIQLEYQFLANGNEQDAPKSRKATKQKKNEIYLHRPCKCTKIKLMYPVLLVI